MKLFILGNSLKEGVIVVSRLTQKSINLPILSNISLKTEKNFLQFGSTDLEIGIRYWTLAKIEKEGEITVPGKTMLGLVNSLSEDKIYLESINNTLLIQGKNFQSKILGQSFEDYPIIPSLNEKFTEIDCQEFVQGLSLVYDLTSPTQIRPELSGIYLSFDKEQILMAASDSFRLGEKKIFLQNQNISFEEKSFILPAKAAREIINIFSEKTGKLTIYLSTNQVMFEINFPEEVSHPQCQIISRLIDGSYPNYKEIIPQQFKTQAIINKTEFLEQIKTASLFAGKVNEIQLEFLPKKNQIGIFSQSPDLGEDQSTILGKIEGERSKVSFNYKFLIDGLLKIKTANFIFQISNEEGPAILRADGDESFFYVVMPIKPS